MTPGGWLIMLASVGFVTGLLVWCIYKVIVTPDSAKHLHAQTDIHTPDLEA